MATADIKKVRYAFLVSTDTPKSVPYYCYYLLITILQGVKQQLHRLSDQPVFYSSYLLQS